MTEQIQRPTAFLDRASRDLLYIIMVYLLRKPVEDWYVSDVRIDAARERQDAVYNGQLNRTGDNLSVVAKRIYDNYPDVFADIMPTHTTPSPPVYS